MQGFEARKKASDWTPTDSVSDILQTDSKTIVLVSPHDDDALLFAGALIILLIRLGYDVHILIVTDGGIGWPEFDQRKEIVETRKKEATRSYAMLGVKKANLHFLGFPNGRLHLLQQMMPIDQSPCEDAPELKGFTGLEWFLTYKLRELRPGLILFPTGKDVHLEHQIVAAQTEISTFHAACGIWDPKHFGQTALEAPPQYAVGAVYGDPELGKPDFSVRLLKGDESCATLAHAGQAYASQQSLIAGMIDRLEKHGHANHFWRGQFKLFDPAEYA